MFSSDTHFEFRNEDYLLCFSESRIIRCSCLIFFQLLYEFFREDELGKTGCREMVFTGKPMKGYVFVSSEGMKTKKQFDYWINLCVEFNKKAKSSKKKKVK